MYHIDVDSRTAQLLSLIPPKKLRVDGEAPPTGVAVSHCITWFQIQLILTPCQIRYHTHCGIIVALDSSEPLIPRGYLEFCELSRLRQLILV